MTNINLKTGLIQASNMADLSYNEFRTLHKGTPSGQLSELWKKYKAGEYEPDVDKDGIHDSVDDEITVEETVEETEEVEEVEEEVEEKTPLQIYQENLQLFADSYKMSPSTQEQTNTTTVCNSTEATS